MADRCSIEVQIPEGMTPHKVARTFAAYLLGARAFEEGSGTGSSPYQDGDNYWQLDGSNDFWLMVDGTVARIRCRYDHEIAVIKAMAVLFNWKHNHHLVFA